MAAQDILLRLRLQGQKQTSAGLKATGRDAAGVGTASDRAAGGMSRAEKQAMKGQRTYRQLGRAAKFAAVAGLGALAYGVKESVQNFMESQKVAAQTNAVIKSTGGAAGVTAANVSDYAASLSRMSGQDDEAIQSGANLLLTFTKIRNGVGAGNDIFDQTVGSMTNMAQALGTPPTNAAKMLGKALNDPVKGITALTRAGVSFTQGQKDTIKRLVESGDTMKAQKMILKELNVEFGGSAAAYGKTLPGQMAKAKVAAENFSEVVGGLLAPYLTRAAQAGSKFANEMSDGEGAGGRFVVAVQGVAQSLQPLGRRLLAIGKFLATHPALLKAVVIGFVAFKTVGLVVFGVTRAMRAWAVATKAVAAAQAFLNIALLANPIVLVIAAVVAVAAAFYLAYTKIGWVRRAVGNVFNFIKQLWPLLRAILTAPFRLAALVIRTVFGGIKRAARAVWGWIKGAWGTLKGVLSAPFRAAASVIRTIFGGIKSVVKGAINILISGINLLIKGINAIPNIKTPFGNVGIPDIGTIPKLASGGTIKRGGMALVGERGPELVGLSRGSTVYDAGQTAGAAGGGGAILAAIRDLANRPIILQVDGREIAVANAGVLNREKAFR